MSLSDDEVMALLYKQMEPHEHHPWKQVGRCVYCAQCNVRLYQGTLPAAKK